MTRFEFDNFPGNAKLCWVCSQSREHHEMDDSDPRWDQVVETGGETRRSRMARKHAWWDRVPAVWKTFNRLAYHRGFHDARLLTPAAEASVGG